MSLPFRDRTDAGRQLASKLRAYAGRPDVLVLALPRGGVPVGYEVACKLKAPLDVLIVRKLGAPGHEELAMGAIASGGIRVLHEGVVQELGISTTAIEHAAARAHHELERREKLYRGSRAAPEVQGRTVILVDDGLATGSTMRAAVAAVQTQNPARIVIAVPLAAQETCLEFANEVDEVVCAETPYPFCSVGSWYDDFSQTTDTEIKVLLERAEALSPRRFC